MALVSSIYGNNDFSPKAIKKANRVAKRKDREILNRCFQQKLIEHATPAEIAMQHILIDLRIQYEFQKIFDKKGHSPKFVDFWLPQMKVAIEIDGGYHGTPIQKWKDQRRTNGLIKHNRKRIHNIIRFTNDEVLNHPELVKERLCK